MGRGFLWRQLRQFVCLGYATGIDISDFDRFSPRLRVNPGRTILKSNLDPPNCGSLRGIVPKERRGDNLGRENRPFRRIIDSDQTRRHSLRMCNHVLHCGRRKRDSGN
jgi:hypothetical protein